MELISNMEVRKECRLVSFEKWGTATDKRWNLSECNFNPVEKILEKSLKTNYLRFTFLCPVTPLGIRAHLPLEHISYVSIQGSFYLYESACMPGECPSQKGMETFLISNTSNYQLNFHHSLLIT